MGLTGLTLAQFASMEPRLISRGRGKMLGITREQIMLQWSRG